MIMYLVDKNISIVVTKIIKFTTSMKLFKEWRIFFNLLFCKKKFILSEIFFIFVTLKLKEFYSDTSQMQLIHKNIK